MSDKKLKPGSNDLDRDLDFMDQEFSFESMEDSDREPRSKPVKSFGKGVRKGLTDTDNIKQLLRKNLPSEYSSAYETLSAISNTSSDIVKDVVKGAKPIVADLAGAADKMLPSSFKKTKAWLQKTQELASKEDNNRGPSKDEQREQGLNIEMARIFEQQLKTTAAISKAEKGDRNVDRGINIAQHRDVLSVLNRISVSTSRTEGYTTLINSAWQKKSLENQYRQLFIMQDMAEEAKNSNAKIIANLMAITKNSALPDYRKTQMNEAFYDQARKNFSNTIVDASQGFFKRGLTKFRQDISQGVSDIASLSSMLALGADLAAMDQEIDPKTLKDRAAEGAGKGVGKVITTKISKKIFELAKKNPKILQLIGNGQNILGNLDENSGSLLSYLAEKNKDAGGLKGTVANYFLDSTANNDGYKGTPKWDPMKMYAAAPFTNKVAHSITDIIPGYLSRILQEQQMTRTGKPAEEIKFDYRVGKFQTRKQIVKSIKESISEKEISDKADGRLSDVFGMLDKHGNYSNEERSKLAKAWTKDASDPAGLKSFNVERMTDVDYWANRLGDYALAEKVAESVKSMSGGISTIKEMNSYHTDKEKIKGVASARLFERNLKNLKHVAQNKRGDLNFLADNGMLEEAIEAGLADSGGDYNAELIESLATIVRKGYKDVQTPNTDPVRAFRKSKFDDNGQFDTLAGKAMDKGFSSIRNIFSDKTKTPDDGLGTSDVFAKTSINNVKGKVLDKLERLKIKSWKYKNGREDGGATTNMGPMAQDLKKEFGDNVAPDGTKIDLVNANGVTMKAVQELSEKVKGFFDGGDKPTAFVGPVKPLTAIECLRNIDANTLAIAGKQDALVNINSEALKSIASGLGTSLSKIDLSGLSKSAQANYNNAVDYVKSGKAQSLLGRFGDTVSDLLKLSFDGAVQSAKFGLGVMKKGAGKAWDGLKFVKDQVSTFAKDRALKVYEHFDVYMDGEKEPVMVQVKIAAGKYLNFETMKPVFTHSDIKSIKTSIVEETSDGEFITVFTAKELEKIYFVNTYTGLVTRAFRTLGSFIKGSFNNIVAPIFKNGWQGLKTVKTGLDFLIDRPIDIFISDDLQNVVLTAKKMREGVYIDFADGSVITGPSQIKGAVYDAEKEEIALTVDEFRKGLVDIKGKKIGNAYIRTVKNAIGLGIGVSMSAGKWALDKISKGTGILGRAAKRGTEMMEKLWERMGLPKFTMGGIFGKESVDILKDIRSILRYQAGLGGSPEELVVAAGKGAVDVAKKAKEGFAKASGLMSGATMNFSGKGAAANDANPNELAPMAANEPAYETQSSGSGSIFSSLTGSVLGGAKGLFNKFRKRKGVSADFVGPMPQEAPKAEATEKKPGIFSKIASAFSNIKNKNNQSDPKAKKPAVVTKDGKQLNANGVRVGSWQDKNQTDVNVNKAKEREVTNPIRKFAIKNTFDMIAAAVGGVKDSIKKWLGKGGGEDAAIEISTGGDGDGKKRRKGKDPKGKKGWLSKGWGAAKGLGGLALKGVGIAGTAYGAYETYNDIKEGNYGDAAINGALTVAGSGATWGLLSGTGMLAGATGALSATAGAIASGTGAIASGIAGAGGAVVSALGWPVILGALAVGAAGYGVYKGVKWLMRKEFNDTERFRMIEYGVGEKQTDLMRKIYELEQYFESISKTTDGEWSLDEKKFKIEKFYDIFDIDKKDKNHTTAAGIWLAARFKPIYGKWKILVKAVGKSDKMDWLEKAPNADLLSLFNQFKNSNEAYGVAESPFKGAKSDTRKDTIEYQKKVWILSIKKKADEKKDEATSNGAKTAGLALLPDDNPIKQAAGVASTATAANLAAAGNLNAATPDKQSNGAKASVTYSAGFTAPATSSIIPAIVALRWKAYGMTSMKITAVQAFGALEVECNKFVKIESDGRATFTGDALEILKTCGGYFGVSESDKDKAKNWLAWFTKRFLPIYTLMHSCVYSYTKRAEIKSNMLYMETMDPRQLLTIGRALISVRGTWTVPEYAFPGEAPNTDPNSVSDNLTALEVKAKDKELQEEKAKQAPPPPKTMADTQKTLSDIKTGAETKSNSGGSNFKAPTQQSSTAATLGLDDQETKKTGDSGSGGGNASSSITGQASNLVTAPGDLYSGAGAMQFISAGQGVDFNGLHPSVRRLFFGMVEEFGQKTGKKIGVNAAFRSPDQQAALFKKYGPGRAARPGSSLHEFGLAIDVNTGDLEAMEKMGLLRKYGFTRPLGSETWHIEPAGLYDNGVRQKAKNDHNFATAYIESGIGRGGGGLGSQRGGSLRRDDKYAKALFDAASTVAKDGKGDETPAAKAPATQGGKQDGAGGSGGGSTPLGQGIPDNEPNKEGKAISGSPSGSSGGDGGAIMQDITSKGAAANDAMKDASASLANKGTGGAYTDLPESKGDGWGANSDLITKAAAMVGIDPALAAAVAAKESSLRPGVAGVNGAAGNSRAQGLYQFMPDTWKEQVQRFGPKYGIKRGTSPLDARANALLGMEYIKQNMKRGNGTAVSAYMGHFLGPAGVARFTAMSANDIPAKTMSGPANNNPNIFFHNGDKSKPRTKAEIESFVGQSLNKQLADFNIPLSIDAGQQPTAVAANDSSVSAPASSSGSSSSSSTQVAETSSSTKATTQVKYSPTNSSPSPYTSGSVDTLMSSAPAAPKPASSSNVVQEIKGLDKLTDTSTRQLGEQVKTNQILGTIVELLKNNQANPAPATMQQASEKASSESSPTFNAPKDVPSSYVQRRRAA